MSAFLIISNTGYRKANCYITVSEIETFAQALEVFGCFLRDLWMWTANANVVVILCAFLRQFVDSDKLVTSYHEGHSSISLRPPGWRRSDLLASGNPFWNLSHLVTGKRIYNIELQHFAFHLSSGYCRYHSNDGVVITTRGIYINSWSGDAFSTITEVENHIIRFSVHAAVRVP